MAIVDSNVISAVIGAGAPTLAAGYQLLRERREKQWQTYKFAYVKIIHLSLNSGPPIYRAFVPRLDRHIEVFDEVHFFRLNVYPRRRREFRSEDRSSGVVDLHIFHPYKEHLSFTDAGAGQVGQFLSQVVEGHSNVFFSRAIYYNGLRAGNEDMSMKMEMNTREARMIVDFSSLAGFQSLPRHPTGRIRTSTGEQGHGVSSPHFGAYEISAKDLHKGDVLRMDFFFDSTVNSPPRSGE